MRKVIILIYIVGIVCFITSTALWWSFSQQQLEANRKLMEADRLIGERLDLLERSYFPTSAPIRSSMSPEAELLQSVENFRQDMKEMDEAEQLLRGAQ